jgi:ATP-binding cassette subfamily B protein
MMDRSPLGNRLRKVIAQLPHLSRALRLVWAAGRGWTAAWVALLFVQGLLPVALVYLTRDLVNGLVAGMGAGDGWSRAGTPLFLLAALAALLLLAEALRSFTGWIRTAQSERVQDHVSGLIHERALAVDLAFYETPEYHDHLHRARAEAAVRPMALVENLGGLLQNGTTLVAMGVVILPYGWWLPAALLVSTLPAFYVVLRFSVRQHELRRRTTADERHIWYYDALLTSRDTAAELRLFDLGGRFRAAYRRFRERVAHQRLRLARDQGLAEMAAGSSALAVTALSMGWMMWRAMQGSVTLGDLALLYQAFDRGQRVARTLLENIGRVYGNVLFLGDLFEFLGLCPRIVDPPRPVPAPAAIQEGIRFRGVTFRYPETGRPVLADFDLAIPAGRIVALMGPNGAGKSTVIKLLCRLYDPDAGAIEVEEIDLRRWNVNDLRRRITVLFQEPVRYSATVAENIAAGDAHHELSEQDCRDAAVAAGADEIVAQLPAGYRTLLGKWFEGGTELSGGEWQRIALSRAFVRGAPILCLDEPTSAMDAWSESLWFERLRTLAVGRTVILVTHRLTTALHADQIHVMDAGRIVESGSHHELLEREGRYAAAWSAQLEAAAPLVPR